MNDRMSQRFQMLIEVAISGGGNFGKLAKGAKKAAIDLKSFNKFLDKNEADLKGTREAIQKYVTEISKIPAKHSEMEKTLIAYNTRLKTSREIIQNLETTLKLNRLAQEKLNSTTVKGSVNITKYNENLHRLQSEQSQTTRTLRKAQIAQAELKGTFEASEREYKRFIATTKKGGIALANYDRRNKKNIIHQKEYSRTLRTAKRALADLNKRIKENSKDAKSNVTAQKKQAKSLQDVGRQTRKVREEFKDWHDMRIRGDKTLKIFRQSLGAIRNQLLVLAFATRGLKAIFDKAFTSTRQMEAALKGLGSVAMNTGAAFGIGERAAMDLAKKGLLSVSDAAAGLKNLLSAGYGLPQAIKLMNTLTDAASFNRQGTLALGEAVVGATQGIKNQNSIMVDNAGITKNLSIMYKEYAAQIGTTMGKLTEAQKRLAIFNGILQEGAIFAGDATKVLQTMEGSLAKLKAQTFVAYAALGDLLKPVIEGIVTVFTEGAAAVTNFFSEKTFKLELIRGARDIGRDLGEMIRSIVTVIGSLLGGINKILPPFSMWSIILLKIVGVLKLKNAIMSRVTKRHTAMNLELKNTVMWTELETMRVKSRNIAEKRMNVSLRGLLITMKAYKAELITTDLAQKKAMLSSKGIEGSWKRLIFTLGTLRARLIVTTGAFRAVGGATVFLAAGLKALWAAIGPLVVAFAAFQAVFWIVEKVFGRSKNIEATNRALARQGKIYKALNKQMESIEETTIKLQKVGATVGVLTLGSQTDFNALQRHYNKMADLHDQYQDSTSEKQRTAIENRLEDLQEGYDKRLSKLTLANQKLTTETQKYYAKRNAIDTIYEDTRDIFFKDEKIKGVVTAELKYQQMLKIEKDFQKIRNTMAKRGGDELLNTERKIAFAHKFIMKQRTSALVDLLQGYYSKSQNIVDKYTVYAARASGSIFDRILEANRVLKERALAQLKSYFDAAKAQMETLKLMFIMTGLEAGTALSRSMQEAMSKVSSLSIPGISFTDDPKLKFIDKRMKERAKKIQDSFKGFKAGTVTVEEFTTVLKRADTSIGNMAFALGKMKEPNEIAIKKLNEYKELLGAIIPALEHKSSVDKIGVEQTTRIGTLMDELTASYQRQQEVIEKGNKAKTDAETAAAGYTQALKQLQINLRITAGAQKLATFELQRYQQLQSYKVEMTYLKDIVTFLKFKTEQIALERAHTVEILKSKQAYDLQMQAIYQKEAAITQEISRLKQIKEGTAEVNGVRVEFTEKEIFAASQRIEALMAETDILSMQSTMYKQAYQDKIDFLDNRVMEEKRLAFQKGLADMAAKGYEFFKNFKDIGQKINAEQRKTNMEFAQQLKDKQVTHGQYNKLLIESDKFYKAKQKLEEAKFTADLIRQVGQQIMAYAAKKAAASGNIIGALAWLAGGYAAKGIINKQAARIESAAQASFDRAELEFKSRQDEILETNKTAEANRTFGGTIKAENLEVTISPTIIIQGETVFIGQGSVTEFASELQQLILKSTQEAIDNREIDLSAISNIGG